MKECFKCGVSKSLDSFYKHKKMKDGHLNKCIDCTKKDVRVRESELKKDPKWVEKERARSRDKYHRLNYKEKQKVWDKDKPWKNKCKSLAKKFKTPKGIELHHWSYNDEHLEDVFFLPINFHRHAHKYLTLDLDERMFRDMDGNLLDTKEKHQRFLDNLRIQI
jgi:hypothetical protein